MPPRCPCRAPGSLAEDDLDHTRAAPVSLPGTALAVTLVLGVRASPVDWASGPGLALLGTVAGPLVAGASGHQLLRSGAGAGGAARSTG